MGGGYSNLIFELPEEQNTVMAPGADPEFIFSPQAYFRGGTQIPGANTNVGFQIITKPFFLDRIPHYHDCEEYLVFLGASFPNVFDFDADIIFSIGEPGVDAEEYHIVKPSVIRIPAGILHNPLEFKCINKPVLFIPILQRDMFKSSYREPYVQGRVDLYYNGPQQCKMNKEKKCDCCRKCIKDDWR